MIPVAPGFGKGKAWRQLSRQTEAEILPQARMSGPMPWVIAIMVALTVIAAAGGLALRNTASSTRAELSGGITVQIVEANPVARAAQTQAAAEKLAAYPGIGDVRVVPPEQVDELIAPWIGQSTLGEEAVPIPALIDARFAGTADKHRVGALQATLREVAPAARVDAQAEWLKPVFDALSSLQWLALALVALLALALAATVLLAARNALGTNRDTIEIVHLLGGTDAQIARVFQRALGFDAAGGGLLGLILGAVAVIFLGQRFAGLGAGMVESGALAWSDWLVLALIPLAGAALAMLTARISVVRALRSML